jgi:hypothetical protein
VDVLVKFSHGDALTAGSANHILAVPAGYDAIVTYLFISNTGANKSISAKWVHNSVDIDFIAGKNVNADEFLEFGGQHGEFLVAKEGDTITLTPEAGSTFVSIISFELVTATPRLNL